MSDSPSALERQLLAIEHPDDLLARVAKRIANDGQTVAMIHIGDHTSHVVIATDGIPHFVRIIPVEVATAAVRRRDEALVAFSEVAVNEPAFETVPPMPSSVTRTRAALRTGGASGETPM